MYYVAGVIFLPMHLATRPFFDSGKMSHWIILILIYLSLIGIYKLYAENHTLIFLSCRDRTTTKNRSSTKSLVQGKIRILLLFDLVRFALNLGIMHCSL